MKSTCILAVLAATALTVSAGSRAPAPVICPVACPADPCAGPISYNNAELLYAYTDFDNSGENGDGAVVRMEFGVAANFYVTATGQYSEAGFVDMWSVSGGVGTYYALCENFHLAVDGGVLWVNYDVESDPFSSANDGWSDDEVGWYVRPHLRAKWGCLEVHAGAHYSEVSEFNIDEWAVFADVYYQIAPQWDLTVGVSHSSDRTTATGGARYRF